MDARGKLGEHERSIRVARGVADNTVAEWKLTEFAAVQSLSESSSKDCIFQTSTLFNLFEEKVSFRAKQTRTSVSLLTPYYWPRPCIHQKIFHGFWPISARLSLWLCYKVKHAMNTLSHACPSGKGLLKSACLTGKPASVRLLDITFVEPWQHEKNLKRPRLTALQWQFIIGQQHGKFLILTFDSPQWFGFYSSGCWIFMWVAINVCVCYA